MKGTRKITSGRAPMHVFQNDIPPCVWPGCGDDAFIDFPLCANHVYEVHQRVVSAAAKPKVRSAPVSPNRRSEAKGLVYFMRFGAMVKIGFTTNLADRVRALRPEEVLGVMDGDMAAEKRLHHEFGKHWLRGELFSLTPEIAEFIKENTNLPAGVALP